MQPLEFVYDFLCGFIIYATNTELIILRTLN